MGWLDKEETEILENSRQHTTDIKQILQDVKGLQNLVGRVSEAVAKSDNSIQAIGNAISVLENSVADLNAKLDKVLGILAPPPAVALSVAVRVINPSGE